MDVDIITFDCYGTLIDWESGITKAFQAEAARSGVELRRADVIGAYMSEEPQVEAGPFQSYREILTETGRRVADRLQWKLGPDRASFLADSLHTWEPFPDTNPALERLATRYQLGFLSNVDDDLLEATRRHFPVQFDLIITAQQVRSYKPGHAHFRKALARVGPKKLLHAAQSYFHDVVPTRSIGIPVVWVNRKNESPAPGGPLPDYEVRNLTGLAELLGV
jgi:2-haloalkanoic acid dehalogenase type II